MKSTKGFSVIELLVTIAIIALLASIASSIKIRYDNAQLEKANPEVMALLRKVTAAEGSLRERGFPYMSCWEESCAPLLDGELPKGLHLAVTVQPNGRAYSIDVSTPDMAGMVYRYDSRTGRIIRTAAASN